MLKDYIETNLAHDFIKSFKLLAMALFFFDLKAYKILCLYINYCDLHNLTIKNCFIFFLDWQVTQFLRPGYAVKLAGSAKYILSKVNQ